MSDINIPVLPPDTWMLEHQVGGHSVQNKKSLTGILKNKDGYILKPLQPPPLGQRELGFYNTVTSDNEDKLLCTLKLFVPEFHGKTTLQVNDTSTEFLMLEDVTDSFSQLCVMDVKMGRRTWDPEATEKKRLREEAKYKGTRCTVGYSIQGMKVVQPFGKEYINLDRDYGKQLDHSSIKDAFCMFLNAKSGLKTTLIQSFLDELLQIACWFRKQYIFKFYSSSLLFVYDASSYYPKGTSNEMTVLGTILENGFNDELLQHPTKSALVKMIDFAHVFPNEDSNLDCNFLEGLENLILLFEELLKESV